METPAPAFDASRSGTANAGWDGSVTLYRTISTRDLALALACVSGGDARPRGERLAALHARIRSGESFTATLSGARIEAGPDVVLTREPGRAGLPQAALTANVPTVWDGRLEITADRSGLTIAPLAGHMAVLSPADRAVARTLPPAARAVLPVLYGDGPERPVLAWRLAEVRCLVPRRLALAMGAMSHEARIGVPLDGETPPASLCLHRVAPVRARFGV